MFFTLRLPLTSPDYPTETLENIMYEFARVQQMIARTRTICDDQPCKNGALCTNIPERGKDNECKYKCNCATFSQDQGNKLKSFPIANTCGDHCECCPGYVSVILGKAATVSLLQLNRTPSL